MNTLKLIALVALLLLGASLVKADDDKPEWQRVLAPLDNTMLTSIFRGQSSSSLVTHQLHEWKKSAHYLPLGIQYGSDTAAPDLSLDYKWSAEKRGRDLGLNAIAARKLAGQMARAAGANCIGRHCRLPAGPNDVDMRMMMWSSLRSFSPNADPNAVAREFRDCQTSSQIIGC